MQILHLLIRQFISSKKSYNYYFPLGDAYIAASIKSYTLYNIEQVNLNHQEGNIQDIIEKLLNKKTYEIILLGGMALQYSIIKKIILSIRSHPSKPIIILGGAIITSLPQEVYVLLRPDIGIIGEGEKTIIELLSTLESPNKDLSKVNGLIYQGASGLITTPPRDDIKNIDSIPFPDYEGFGYTEFLDNAHSTFGAEDIPCASYFDYPRIYKIAASRGCPYKCTFCYHYGSYRERSISNIQEELKSSIIKYRINIVSFVDETITQNRARLIRICNMMTTIRTETPWDLRWILLGTTNIHKDDIALLKNSGAICIVYGFESMSNLVLQSMNKATTAEMHEQTFLNTLNQGISVSGNFIFGDKAETEETAEVTLEWWKKNAKDQIVLSWVEPYPGSNIFNYCLHKNIIKIDENYFQSIGSHRWLNMTSAITNKKIQVIRQKVLQLPLKYRNHGIILKKIKESKNVYTLTIQCPYCGKSTIYKNCLIVNILLYGFYLLCRHCSYKFYISGPIRKAWHNQWLYNKTRFLANIYSHVKYAWEKIPPLV